MALHRLSSVSKTTKQAVQTMGELPASWNHSVSVKIEVEKLSAARLERRQAFAHKWTTSELEGNAIDIGIAPEALAEFHSR